MWKRLIGRLLRRKPPAPCTPASVVKAGGYDPDAEAKAVAQQAMERHDTLAYDIWSVCPAVARRAGRVERKPKPEDN